MKNTTKRASGKASVGTRIAVRHGTDVAERLDANATPCEGSYLSDDDNIELKEALARQIDAAIRRAVREAFEAGRYTGYWTQDPPINRHGYDANSLSKKYQVKL